MLLTHNHLLLLCHKRLLLLLLLLLPIATNIAHGHRVSPPTTKLRLKRHLLFLPLHEHVLEQLHPPILFSELVLKLFDLLLESEYLDSALRQLLRLLLTLFVLTAFLLLQFVHAHLHFHDAAFMEQFEFLHFLVLLLGEVLHLPILVHLHLEDLGVFHLVRPVNHLVLALQLPLQFFYALGAVVWLVLLPAVGALLRSHRTLVEMSEGPGQIVAAELRAAAQWTICFYFHACWRVSIYEELVGVEWVVAIGLGAEDLRILKHHLNPLIAFNIHELRASAIGAFLR